MLCLWDLQSHQPCYVCYLKIHSDVIYYIQKIKNSGFINGLHKIKTNPIKAILELLIIIQLAGMQT